MNNILILTAGNKEKLSSFKGVETASFDEIKFDFSSGEMFMGSNPFKNFSVIYFRLVGKSLELATLVTSYALKNGIKLIDRMYESAQLMPPSLSKLMEIKILSESGVKTPKTVFNDFESLPYPYIVKSTSGQKGREVWLVNNKEELEKLKTEKFEKGKFYFAQELVPNAVRIRVLTIGNRVVGAVARHTKWNKDETKETLTSIPADIEELSLKASSAVKLDICGVDILVNKVTREKYVIEANAAPSWKLINKYCGVVVEDEIVKYLQTKV